MYSNEFNIGDIVILDNDTIKQLADILRNRPDALSEQESTEFAMGKFEVVNKKYIPEEHRFVYNLKQVNRPDFVVLGELFSRKILFAEKRLKLFYRKRTNNCIQSWKTYLKGNM